MGIGKFCKGTEFARTFLDVNAQTFLDKGREIAELDSRAMAIPQDIRSLLNLLDVALWVDHAGSRPYDPPTIFRVHSSFETTPENIDALKNLDPALKSARKVRFSEASAHSVLDLVETIEKPTADLNKCPWN